MFFRNYLKIESREIWDIYEKQGLRFLAGHRDGGSYPRVRGIGRNYASGGLTFVSCFFVILDRWDCRNGNKLWRSNL